MMTLLEMAVAIHVLNGKLDLSFVVADGSWVATCGVDIAGDGLLRGTTSRGVSPEAAVKALWMSLTLLEEHLYVRLRSGGAYRWNGFMWAPVVVEGGRDANTV